MDSFTLSKFFDMNSDDTVDFCHFEYERNTVDTAQVWGDIFGDAYGEDTQLIVVFSDADPRQYQIICGWQSVGNDAEAIPSFSYTDFFNYAKTCWSDPERTMDQKSIFIIDIDPHMPIDCAIALMAATQLSMDRAPYSKTRLLTVSCDAMERSLVRLARHHGLPEPKHIVHDDTSWEDNEPEDCKTIYCKSLSEVDERFIERTGNVEEKHILLTPHECEEVIGELKFDDSWRLSTIGHGPKALDDIYNVFNARVEGNVVVSLPHRFYSPFPLSGYDHIHVIVQTGIAKSGFDFEVGQPTSFDQQLSIPERCELRALVNRLGTKPLSATFYVMDDSERLNELEWWETGPRLRRQDVWNESLGAFMAVVASLGPRVDAAATVACFVPEGLNAIYRTVAYRLQVHGILEWGEEKRLTLRLGGPERLAFYTVLPFVKYDYRLAYFVAQEPQNGSDSLRQTKIQMAAVINSGGITMFNFRESLEQSHDTLQDVINACSGYSQPLSDMGNMWLALGLWKRLAQHTQSFQNVLHDDHIELPRPLRVTAIKSLCREALQSWKQISSALEANGIESRMKSFEEESILSVDECNEIQTHLFKAYMSQLTCCYRGKHGTAKPEFLDISSQRVIDGFMEWSSVTIDLCKVATVRPAFGIYHSLRRMDTKVLCTDWTMIPFEIVSRSVEEFQDRVGEPELDIEPMLRTDIKPQPNYDSMTK